MVDESSIRSRYAAAGQEHVLQHFESLSAEEQTALLTQLDEIPVEDLASLLEAALAGNKEEGEAGIITPFSKTVGTCSNDEGTTKEWYHQGLEAIANGTVAALVLAGGQGTRLGFNGPKGCYNIGLPSGRTLFQLLVDRLKRLKTVASSAAAENDYFGLMDTDILFFQQGMLPCLTNEGKIIMETSGRVAMAPDGNGGIYPSLKKSGMLDNMNERGIKYLHVFSIDNALTKIADPTFIGYCIKQDADCGNKSVWKAAAHEKVGVIAEKGGKPCVVEYSEITKEMAERTNADGHLAFGAANICSHFYTLDFMNGKIMPRLGNIYHIARKKIPYYDEAMKETVKPEANNGIKLESFIFDIFPLSERMAVFSGPRDDEFAPVKNAPGSPADSPDTARVYLSNQAKRWVQQAGGLLQNESGTANDVCEISPLTSYGGEGLEELVGGKQVSCPFSL